MFIDYFLACRIFKISQFNIFKQSNITYFSIIFNTLHNYKYQGERTQGEHIFASQGLRFGSPFSPPLADLEYILKFAHNATWWLIEVAPLR